MSWRRGWGVRGCETLDLPDPPRGEVVVVAEVVVVVGVMTTPLEAGLVGGSNQKAAETKQE